MATHNEHANPRLHIQVLLVDDDRVSQLLTAKLLRRNGCTVETANNGQSALEMIRDRHYDLVILDLEMPVLDGWETIRIIRANEDLRGLFVVALSAHSTEEARRKCIESGCDEFLPKPVNEKSLVKTIRAMQRLAAQST